MTTIQAPQRVRPELFDAAGVLEHGCGESLRFLLGDVVAAPPRLRICTS